MKPQEKWLRRLLSLHDAGTACFPSQMGLNSEAWRGLLWRLAWRVPAPDPQRDQRQALMTELQHARLEESAQLAAWLGLHMAEDASPMHQLIACASMGFNHLWQDLGLDSRAELRELMIDCFPTLVVMNHQNMRWKKFFYRQRCLQMDGDLVCRSPSCDDCCEWALCFAPET
ncbi:nitrogen fixation protein NifQ [Pectobacteriaceae bacterium CE70]|uniref:Nitrogen fixation protein NifQ n=1 Tax=Serratia sp. (strain ATCC 39006) TaxID=104623 RepID=A0A2I5T417_SERS3|nr:nitrogen fixation protein NifQ [Serratia sp. ATCC 39006]WJV62107.1 nitrogen fixation protein NifQ [Pectobacteriaceae bacterium C52]WJV66386.1 nitrogen fixation protein NifQ [Pectobacteriaceae bacterium CE70]WJY10392.1 nitrogen fixation protein NifQ [Pectobacteriaceae bacterium C80]AUG99303.1 nitrogen fixation protein NifQ [Serratia sp. ATCC 39006]AUH03621.1 nitrogen fixation protein NifQ [Serratia sp. ATCC 39006]